MMRQRLVVLCGMAVLALSVACAESESDPSDNRSGSTTNTNPGDQPDQTPIVSSNPNTYAWEPLMPAKGDLALVETDDQLGAQLAWCVYLVMYDHATKSLWLRLWTGPVSGSEQAEGKWLDQVPLSEMTWAGRRPQGG